MSTINENSINKDIERQSDRYWNKYRDHMDILESGSLISQVRPVTSMDFYQLGKQLSMFEEYRNMCEEDGTLSQLGKLPDVAFDIITVNYGTSPISVISSIQSIEEERGNVYFRQVSAQTTRGNVTSGDIIMNPLAQEGKFPTTFAGDKYTVTIDTTDGDTADDCSSTGPAALAAYLPLRPGKVSINVADSVAATNYTLVDDGTPVAGVGKLVGASSTNTNAAWGTVNYNSGAITINYSTAPTASVNINVTSSTDFAGASTIPQINGGLTTRGVNARVFALKETVGLEQAYALKKRFGLIAEEEIAADLISAINAEICGQTITQLASAALGTTYWSKAAPTGVAYVDHKNSFKDKLADAEAVMVGNAGRGAINVLVAGRAASALISTLDGFVKLSDGSGYGPNIFGTLDGMTVVRVPNSSVLDTNTVIGIYKGGRPFEAASVFASYMPLVVTSALPTGVNPLLQQRAAAVWAAIDVLIPAFATKIVIQ